MKNVFILLVLITYDYLLCNLYSIYTIYNCGREQHNTTWWAAGLTSMIHQFAQFLT